MKILERAAQSERASEDTESGSDLLQPLVRRAANSTSDAAPVLAGAVIGNLIGMTDDGRTPLVVFRGQTSVAAVAARAVVDLHGGHIGRCVVLLFEEGDPARPIIMGVVQSESGWPLEQQPNKVEVDADGRRLVVSAEEQLVLRCGKARITLTSTGKVLIEGAYVSSRSSGVNRIHGGSVQIN